MAETPPRPDPTPQSPDTEASSDAAPSSPLRCFSGALISGSLTILLYRMMTAISTTYAAKPVISSSATAVKISVAVRTLVVGIVTLGTGVFAFTTLGLVALGIQITIQKLRKSAS